MEAFDCVQLTLPSGENTRYIESSASEFTVWKVDGVLHTSDVEIFNVVDNRQDEFPDITPDMVRIWLEKQSTIPSIRSGSCNVSDNEIFFRQSIQFQDSKLSAISCSSNTSDQCGIRIAINRFALGDGPLVVVDGMIFSDSFE